MGYFYFLPFYYIVYFLNIFNGSLLCWTVLWLLWHSNFPVREINKGTLNRQLQFEPVGTFFRPFFSGDRNSLLFFVFFYDGIQNRYFQPNLIRTKWFLCLNLSRRSGVTREKQKERAEAEQTSSSNRKKHWVWTYLWFFRSVRSWHLFRPLGCNWKQFNTDKEDYKQRQLFSITALLETIS